jgi:hypothetical protein
MRHTDNGFCILIRYHTDISLDRQCINKHVVSVIITLHGDAQSKVQINESLSHPFPIERSVLQGSSRMNSYTLAMNPFPLS